MDYVDWCRVALEGVAEASRTSIVARREGVGVDRLARTLFGNGPPEQEDFGTTTKYRGIRLALADLEEEGLLEVPQDVNRPPSALFRVTREGREFIENEESQWTHWWALCATAPDLESDQQELFDLVNRRSPREAADHAWLEFVDQDDLLAALRWGDGQELLPTVTQELRSSYELLKPNPLYYPEQIIDLGEDLRLRATYRGLVIGTKSHLTVGSERIDRLVEVWETTSVEFKGELHTRTKDQKAELVKDLLGLANTQASGERLLVVGFDDKTHGYHGSLDTDLTRDNLERIMSPYTEPYLEVRYEVIQHREGPVGIVEVLRDPKKLPYKVARSGGDRKRIREGQIFVRHGSQTEEPTPAELQALQEEAERARAEQD